MTLQVQATGPASVLIYHQGDGFRLQVGSGGQTVTVDLDPETATKIAEYIIPAAIIEEVQT